MPKKTVFDIPYPNTKGGKAQWSKRFGLNAYYSGKVWQARKADADYWHKLVAYEMERQNVRKYPHDNPVILTFWFNDRLDCSNHAIYAKMIEDAMKGRVIKDDNRTWVHGVEMYFHDEDCIRVAVREV